MAERRMFSKTIVHSARMLKLSNAARLLYYDLGMAADDDGFTEAFCVLRMTGAGEDVLDELVGAGLVTRINADLVIHITDWTANNQIRRDRHHPSIYAPCLPEPAADDNHMSPNPATEYRLGKVSIGKDRIGKAREEEERKEEISADQDSPEAAENSFREPTYAQVSAHFRKNHIPLDPMDFLCTCHAQGWLDSAGQPVQDWTDCILLQLRDRRRAEKDAC